MADYYIELHIKYKSNYRTYNILILFVIKRSFLSIIIFIIYLFFINLSCLFNNDYTNIIYLFINHVIGLMNYKYNL